MIKKVCIRRCAADVIDGMAICEMDDKEFCIDFDIMPDLIGITVLVDKDVEADVAVRFQEELLVLFEKHNALKQIEAYFMSA